MPSWATPAPMSAIGRGYNSKMEVVVGEADPRSYAIIYYQDSQGLSVKLYGGLAWGSGCLCPTPCPTPCPLQGGGPAVGL